MNSCDVLVIKGFTVRSLSAFYNFHSIQYSVQCTSNIVQCTSNSVQCTSNSVQRTMNSAQSRKKSVLYMRLNSVQDSLKYMHIAHFTLYNISDLFYNYISWLVCHPKFTLFDNDVRKPQL